MKVIPEEIREVFEAALKVKNINKGIFAMSLRKTIEMIFLDQGAKGNLNKQIKDLVNKNIFPKTFGEVIDFVRIIGNEGAHSSKFNCSQFTIDKVIKFVRDIINYLYILPDEINVFSELNG